MEEDWAAEFLRGRLPGRLPLLEIRRHNKEQLGKNV
jgi:hypothetical protein